MSEKHLLVNQQRLNKKDGTITSIDSLSNSVEQLKSYKAYKTPKSNEYHQIRQ